MMKTTLTTANPHGLKKGDTIILTGHLRWWVRLWRWVTRYKDPVYYVTEVTATTMTVTSRK